MATRKLTLKEFISANRYFESLIRATVRQLGGWEFAQESFINILKNGSEGISGFVYCWENRDFALKNRKQICELLDQQSVENGEDLIDMISNFGIFRGKGIDDKQKKTLIKFLGGGRITENDNIDIINLMAWYAAEEVARMYENYIYS